MKFPSIFKSTNKPMWDWPSCNYPKTLSFRAKNDAVFKTLNSVFFVDRDDIDSSLFTDSTVTDDGDSLETVVRSARSERLFFEPDDTSSILDKSKPMGSEAVLGFKASVMESIESANPYEDFRKSMGEMVESHGVKDWEGLEELLGWYLKANWKNNHRFIIGAFVDLLIDILLSSSSPSSSSSSSSSSCCNSDLNYHTCVESSCSCAPSLQLLDRSIRREVGEEDDDEITEIM